MTRSSLSGLRGWAVIVLTVVTVSTLVACNGPTVVDAPESVGDFGVKVSMDPQMLNPPQTGTISYALTDNRTGKPVKAYTPVFGALFHNILISRDLEHFQHTFTDRILLDSVSLPVYFPIKSTYNSYGIFQPEGSDGTVYAQTIEAGSDGDAPALTDQMATETRAREYGLQIEMLTGPEPVRAGQDAQVAFYITEFGQPVTGLWPFLDEAGYLWIVDSQGGKFTWEVGTAASQSRAPSGSATPTANQAASSPVPTSTSTPTLIPALRDHLATRTAQPVSTIPPVQQTAQTSLTQQDSGQPATTYGPYVLFSHSFPDAGLYKMWFEFKYRNQVVDSDWVIKVEP